MRLAVLALLLCVRTAFADSPRDAVDALPELAKVSRGRVTVVVRGAIPKAKQREMVVLVEQVIADTTRRFGIAKGDPHPIVTLCLFPDLASYKQVAGRFGPLPSEWGFYLPTVRIAFANIGASIGNLRHELAHPMIDDDFPTIPAWVSEGIGSLYGTSRWVGDSRPDKGRFEWLVNYRLRDLQKALAANTLPTFAELAASTSREVHGPDGMTYYAYGRYVLLYAEQRNVLGKLYNELRAAPKTDHGKILARHIDETAFRAWARKLRY
jgi:hypothetical protein